METAITTLYRAVSEAQYQQLARTGRFELLGAAEGKYFWGSARDAFTFALIIGDPHVVAAVFDTKHAATFDVIPKVDAIGPARFAPENTMNVGLLKVILI